MEFNEDIARRICYALLEEARGRRESAGYNGSWSDYGAADLEHAVDMFLCGLTRRWPHGWEAKAEKITKHMTWEIDPDYKEFLRLKEKFKEGEK